MTKLKNRLKKLYFYGEFKNSQKNPHLTWKTIRSVLSNKHNRVLPNSLRVNGTITDESTYITNEFNNFFCNIGAKLAKNINYTSKKKLGDYLTKRIKESIFFKSPTDSEAMKEILSFNDKKAIGDDKISALFLKIGRHVIAPYFNLFLQFIFNNGIYPNNCKIARVVPVYKNGNRTEINNYRPISILSCFSKIIEKLIYARFIDFFRKHDVFTQNSMGFKKKFPPHMQCLTW